MGRRLQAYMHQNRLGTFTFLWRLPDDIVGRFAQRAFEYSLGTKLRREAWHRALPITMRVLRLITTLRAMQPPKNRPFTTELVRSLLLPDGSEERVDYDPCNPAEVAEAARVFAEIKKSTSVPTESVASAGQVSPSSQTPHVTKQGGPTISAAFAAFCAEKRAEGAWKDPDHAERYDHGLIIRQLIEVTGDRAIATITVNHLRQFKQRLLDDDAAIRTKKKKLQRLSAFLNWAREVAEYTSISTAILKLGNHKGEAAHYHPFDDDDLKALFVSEDYRTQTFTKASHFWIPLLGLYTGARVNELAQLLVDDIAELDGVPVVRINDEGDKRTKTPASTRTVPLHPSLVAAGLLTYKEGIKAEGWHRLFPELTKSKVAKNGYGKEPSEHFTAYRRQTGVSPNVDRQKVFHSFRTTANSALRYLDVPLERRQRLVGHEPSDTNNADYRPSDREKMFPIATLLDDMTRLNFGLTHPTYIDRPRHQQERLRAARRRANGDHRGEPADLVALGRLAVPAPRV